MIGQEATELHASALIVDLHCDILLTTAFLNWNWEKRHRTLIGSPLMGHCDIPRMKEGNLGCLGLGLVTNPLSGPGAIDKMLGRMERKLEQHADVLELATTAQGIRSARQRGRIACFGGLEGVHSMRGSLDQLESYAQRGLRYVGFAHFSENAACKPMVGWGADKTTGLSDFGRALQAECERLRLVVDVAHVNRAGVLELCELATRPLICSHTACTHIFNSPRGLDDAQIKAIADTGGVIGVIFVSFFLGSGGVQQVVRHLTHIKDLVGVEHCALGTDWEGWALYPSDLNSADKLPLLTQALLDAGWTSDEVLSCYGENFLRVLEEVAGRGGRTPSPLGPGPGPD